MKLKFITNIAVVIAIALTTFLGCTDVSNAIGGRADDFLTTFEETPGVQLVGITAVYNQGSTVILPSTPLNNLKSGLTVTARYIDNTTRVLPATAYQLSGALNVGTSVITVTFEDQTATFSVTVTMPDLPDAPLTEITAEFDDRGPVYAGTTLDDLKERLVVTAHYDDGTTRVLGDSEYELSGTLSFPTQTQPSSVITITHVSRNVTRTATFNVTMTLRDALASLYKTAPPVLPSHVPVDLSLTSGATLLNRMINYMNANPDTYTLVLESDIEIVGQQFSSTDLNLTQSGIKLTIVGDGAERKINNVSTTSSVALNLGSFENRSADIELTITDDVALVGIEVRMNTNIGLFSMQERSKIIRGGVNINSNGTFIMQDNAEVSGDITTRSGGGVSISGGTFIMRDYASVYNGRADVSGSTGSFIMEDNAAVYGDGSLGISASNGGTITMRDNTSVHGSTSHGVSLSTGGGNLIMEGNASIYDNYRTGVWMGGGSTFVMNDNASVYGNSEIGVNVARITGSYPDFVMNDNASVYGNGRSGVYLEHSNFSMNGNASIYGNNIDNTTGRNGGGVSMLNGSFTMTGGTIHGNSATGTGMFGGRGGGVYITGNRSEFVMSGGTIYGLDAPHETQRNTAEQSGAALFLDNGTAIYGDDSSIISTGAGVDLTIIGRQ